MKIYAMCAIVLLFFASFIPKPNSETIPIMPEDNIWVVAHRALTGLDQWPENSIATIESCIKHNIAIIEIDVRETKDGHLVIMHDKNIDRTTTGKGPVKDLTLAQIRGFNLSHKGEVTTERVPTLEEVFKLIKGKRIYVDLDVKMDSLASYTKIAHLIKQYKIEDQIIVFSYDNNEIEPMHKMFPHVSVMPRVRSFSEIQNVTKYDFINIIHIDENCYDDQLMQMLIRNKKRIWMNTLGKYDDLEKEGQNGFQSFFRTYPNVNVVQTDLAVQLIEFLKDKGLNN
ncbi:glycerophosphodiester phosphodiesterase family protein [Sphingobacterium rhinopitheci]|uniref:glycerophosphodiester phosphodiesterase family protein n=1 Tax=Sphingobacterium rhinopitheci TaxID=2781960 RepID=UPI001F51F5B2|nr:glycerophosphodiester phosphodiesterase family protein [Sphingobacterium rhinopitheci]MCI0922039.1 glycerophosphodiester phosphodiesterase family protein [Sphingobacterium rhinopitheci]